MTEFSQAPEQQQSPEQQMIQESQHRFTQKIEELGQNIPELLERPEVLEAGKELITQYGIKPSLFEAGDRSLVFAGIASRAVDAKNMSGDQADKENTFIADTIALIGYKHSDRLKQAAEIIQSEESGYDEVNIERVYEKYTDKELTVEVKDKLQNGFLAAVKHKLGVTAENEDPFDVRVLSIADSSQLFGIDAPKLDYSLHVNDPEYQAALQLQRDVQEWKKGLEKRESEFAQEMGEESTFGPAWVHEYNGNRTLCISSALAEKIRDPEVIKNTDWYNQDELDRDLAILAHEYTHTQGGIKVKGEVTFGINLEELRAERFSGDKQGYQEVKAFFQYYNMLTGQNVAEEMDSRVKGGTTEEAFGAIANTIGLSKMTEIMLAVPNNYVTKQSNVFLREAYEHIGGLDGVLKSLYDMEVDSGNEEAINERVTKVARKLNEMGMDLEFFSGYRKKHGLEFMTDILVARANALKDAEPSDI
jgi:hypothetical protein